MSGSGRPAAGRQPDEPRRARQEGAERLPHHQRGRRRAAHPAARAALLGDQVPAGQAAEARRRPALLPARTTSAAAPHLGPALHPGLHDQGRAAPVARGRRPSCPTTSRPPRPPSAPRPRPSGPSRPRCPASRRRHRRASEPGDTDEVARPARRCCALHWMSWSRCGRCSIRAAAAKTQAGRSVAQPGSASVWGTEGRGFESRRSDHPEIPCGRRTSRRFCAFDPAWARSS